MEVGEVAEGVVSGDGELVAISHAKEMSRDLNSYTMFLQT